MKTTIITICFLAISLFGSAQIKSPVKWAYAAKRLNDKEAVLFLKAEIQDGWHIYSVTQEEGGPIKTSFKFNPSKDFTLIGKVLEPKPIKKYEEVFDMNVFYLETAVIFQQRIRLNKAQTIIKGLVEFMACTEKECLPASEVEFSIPII